MSDNDDIEKLLREIDGVTGGAGSTGGAQPPARRPDAEVQKSDESSGGTGLAIVVAAVVGVIGLVLGAVLTWVPGIGPVGLGLGGFLGAFIGVLLGRRFG